MPDFEINYTPSWTTMNTTTTGGTYIQAERPAKVTFGSLDLYYEYRVWSQQALYDSSRHAFAAYIEGKVSDPENVVINWCGRCGMPRPDEMEDIQGQLMCTTCVRDYVVTCAECEQKCILDATLPDGTRLCGSCRNERYSYCDYCGNYYANGEDHWHRNSPCDCPPPTTEIRLRRAETGRILREDKKAIVDLPDGFISGVGMQEIKTYLQMHGTALMHQENRDPLWRAYINLSSMVGQVDEVTTEWQTKRGNFTKRLASYAYKVYGLKMDPDVLTQVGNIGRAHSKGTRLKVAFTRDLNQGRGAFVHTGSCWWSDYNSSRCILKSNGGFGMRTYANGPRTRATGRAWVLPLIQVRQYVWQPTFDSLHAENFVVFNGYGDLEDFAPARILGEILGLPYKKIGFDDGNDDDNDDGMYVNNESGYLVSTDPASTNEIHLSLERHSTRYTEEKEKVLSHG